MIEILESAQLNSVQDMGRSGLRSIGVGTSGAMDRLALALGNMMVGNPPGHAGLEVTLAPLRLRFKRNTLFSLAGADFNARLDARVIPPWSACTARAGQRLVLAGGGAAGARAYFCVQGGLDVPCVLGSRSTDMKGGFGGPAGRSLKKRDRLYTAPGEYSELITEPGFAFCIEPPPYGVSRGCETIGRGSTVTVRFLEAAQYEWLDEPGRRAFLDTAWRITPDSNRMGFRLAGPEIDTNALRRELPSHGIVPGVIQLPPSKQPIVQLSDGNTCGGYAKLGVVITPDLRLVAQSPLGASLKFNLVHRDEALDAVRRETQLIDDYARSIAASLSRVTA